MGEPDLTPTPSNGSHDDRERDRIARALEKIQDSLPVARPMPTSAGTSLCQRCRYGFIYRRREANNLVIRCERQTHEPFMPEDVVECSGFTQKGRLTPLEMAEMATLISDKPNHHDPAYK